MSTPNPTRVTQARIQARASAGAAGIDREFISDLVETFYEHIRAHPALGPIFDRQIGDDWGPHLETMKTFWGSLTFHDGQYSGRPMPAHMRLKDVTPEHFDIWLGLFDRSLDEVGAGTEAHDFFHARASRIAESFKLHMFFMQP